MDIDIIAFSTRGRALAYRIATSLREAGDTVSVTDGFGTGKKEPNSWTADGFEHADALVYVGATGIAVRSIAPYLKSKTSDPAIIVIDERARHCISLLSGHIGGANDLALRIAGYVGADPVITTATDVNDLFAIDSWAVGQGMKVQNAQAIKRVSSQLLRGHSVVIASEFPIEGAPPEGVVYDYRAPAAEDGGEPKGDSASGQIAQHGTKPHDPDATVGIHAHARGLSLVPRVLVLGIGCRRGTEEDAIERAFSELCREEDLLPEAFASAATIDLKSDEEGLIGFCDSAEIALVCFSADELNAVPGTFASSEFVKETTGTDNVCERAAVAAGAELLVRRRAGDGITMAVGIMPTAFSWKRS